MIVTECKPEVAIRKPARTATIAMIQSNLQEIGGVHVPIKVDQLRQISRISIGGKVV